MASPELTPQPPFSFDFVEIRPDLDTGATFPTSRLAWVIGHRESVISLTGSSATAISSPGGDAHTSVCPHEQQQQTRQQGVSGGDFLPWR